MKKYGIRMLTHICIFILYSGYLDEWKAEDKDHG